MCKDPRVCGYCGKQFMAERFRINAGYAKFCSKDCYHKSTRRRIDCTCECCGRLFTVRPSEAEKGEGRFCSDSCYRVFRREETHVGRACQQCGKRFTLTRADLAKTPGIYCSRQCRDASRCKPRIVKSCKQCGVEFTVYPYVEADPGQGKFCSKDCIYQWMSENFRGENSPSWRGGTSFEPYGPEWTESLRVPIRERDDYRCAICRLHGKAVHHIDYCKTNHAPENLISLCNSCHSTTNFNRGYWQAALSGLMEGRLSGV